MKLSISRYDPERDAKPFLQDYEIDLVATDHMLLDVLLRLKAQDNTLSFRRSCREGVCGSDAMNINGRNGLACITRVSELREPTSVVRSGESADRIGESLQAREAKHEASALHHQRGFLQDVCR